MDFDNKKAIILRNEDDTVRAVVIPNGGMAVGLDDGTMESVTVALMCVKGSKPFDPLITNMPAELLAEVICKKFKLIPLGMTIPKGEISE